MIDPTLLSVLFVVGVVAAFGFFGFGVYVGIVIAEERRAER